MPDREKVIKGLEHCSEDGCEGCPYEPDCLMADGFSELARDAMELLKEQETVEPERRFLRPDKHFDTYRCKSCDFMHLRYGQQFCGGCGRKVKWDAYD